MSPIHEMYKKSFGFPVPEYLENDRLRLEVFEPEKHAERFMAKALQHPKIWDYIPMGPFPDTTSFIKTFCDPESDLVKLRFTLFAIIDKTREDQDPSATDGTGKRPALAGMIAYLNTIPQNLVTEIGAVVILPPFQRSHVASNAVGLMLHYALDTPSAVTSPLDGDNTQTQAPTTTFRSPCPPLGLRRVVWQANFLNTKSVNLAKKMGFRFEGILRWDRVLPEGKEAVGNGVKIRENDPRPKRVGRDTALLALCWDDWEEGGREKVDQSMNRTA